jgi:hypothetical protein
VTPEHRRALEAERERLYEAADAITQQLTEVEFGPMRASPGGGVDIPVVVTSQNHEAVRFLAMSFAKSLGDAPNYMAMQIRSDEIGWMEVCIQRRGKLTPHEGRRLAEAEVQRLLAVCEAHGIHETARIDLAPPAALDVGEATTDGPDDWLVIDYKREPNDMLCKRCGTRQPMPARYTNDMVKAMTGAFAKKHGACLDLTGKNGGA